MKLPALFLALLSGAQVLGGNPVHREEEILIGGIGQYITINGDDSSLPVLLFLHGGPGGSVMRYAHSFTDRLQKHFVVVHWDQRETGKTLQLNPSPLPLTLALFQSDTHELITLLLKRFNRKKLFLAGHSWGTALGFHIAHQYPELLYAWIAIGPMIDQNESERVALSLMREKALKTANRIAAEELSKVRIPFESGEQLYYHRKWLLDFSGSHRSLSRQYVEEWAATWLALFNQASRERLPETLTTVHCPVYFFVGRHDYQTNARIAKRYFDRLSVPKKGFFWFEHSGHGIPASEPELLQRIIIERILPQTFGIPEGGVVVGTQ